MISQFLLLEPLCLGGFPMSRTKPNKIWHAIDYSNLYNMQRLCLRELSMFRFTETLWSYEAPFPLSAHSSYSVQLLCKGSWPNYYWCPFGVCLELPQDIAHCTDYYSQLHVQFYFVYSWISFGLWNPNCRFFLFQI